MKKILLSIMIISLLGCAHEAPYVDHEFGKAASDAFDKQIIYSSPNTAEVIPTGMPGIHSEKIMDTYHYSFTREEGDAPTNNFSRGVLDTRESLSGSDK